MIDFVGTSPFLRKALWVAMATMHFHIAQTRLFIGNLFSHLGGPREQFGSNLKLSLGCKVGQIRSLGSWFEAEISLFMMFFYVFGLLIRLPLILLNMQICNFVQPLDEKTCQIVSMMI